MSLVQGVAVPLYMNTWPMRRRKRLRNIQICKRSALNEHLWVIQAVE